MSGEPSGVDRPRDDTRPAPDAERRSSDHVEILRLLARGRPLREVLDALVASIEHESQGELVLVQLARDLAGVAIESDRERCAASRLEEELSERDAQRNDEIQSFTHSISHDLRAPLRAIDGRLAMIAEDLGPALAPEVAGHLEAARRAARDVSDMIDDLLTLSHCGSQRIKPVTIEPARLVEDAWEALQLERNGRSVELEVGDLPPCVADRSLLAQVWSSLVSNAVKYTRERDVAHVHVGGRREPGEVVYWIRDNGVGFDPARAEDVFVVFRRLHPLEAHDGTGVGLALVKRIVERHGGRAWAESTPGEGALFAFALPV